MKSTLKKTLISVIVAIIFTVATVVSCVMLLTNRDNSSGTPASSLADSELTTPSKLDITSTSDSVTRGGTVTLTFTFSSRPNRVWYSGQVLLMPVDENGDPDQTLAQYVTWESLVRPVNMPGLTQEDKDIILDYNANIVDKTDPDRFEDYERGLFMMFARGQSYSLSSNTSFVYQATLKIDENIPTTYTQLRLGPVLDSSNFINTIPNATTITQQRDTLENGLFSMTDLILDIRDKNDTAEIEKIVLGVGGDNDGDITINKNGTVTSDPSTGVYEFDANGDVTIYLPDSAEKIVSVNYPTMETGSEGAKVEAGVSVDKPTEPAAWSEVSTTTALDVTVEPDSNVIHVKATPETENADNVKEYTITCIFTYVRLSDLEVEAALDSSLSSVTNNGFKDPETYDEDTYAYEIYVPGDFTTITPTVVADYGASSDVALVGTSCTIASTPVTSGTAFDVTDIVDGATVTLTVTAAGGYPSATTHTYTLTFVVVSTEIDFNIVVTGATSNKTMNNNPDKATAKSVDYYYAITESDPVQAKMTLTAADGAKIEVASYTDGVPGVYSDYNPTTIYNPGYYIIKVTAEAGNYEEYIVLLVQLDVLKLTDVSTYNFITLKASESNARRKYRRSYDQIGWTHGIDDIDNPDVQKVVLGDIKDRTTIDALVSNFDPDQLSKICVYNADDDLIYNNGTVVDGLSTAQKRVATGWRVEFGTGDTKDIVYISILGDVDGDGLRSANDVSELNSYLAGMVKFDEWDFDLAARVENDGSISATDVADMNSILVGLVSIEDFFTYNQTI